jgi:hypothetical protein
MLCRRPWLTLLLTVVLLGTLGALMPAGAHGPVGEPVLEVEAISSSGDAVLPGWVLSAAPETPGLSWPALAVVLAVVGLGWWRPRRMVAFALVLLLTVFAFEDGVHSVHHGLDQTNASTCAMAAVGTHLSAAGVDGAAQCDVILPVVALAAEPSPPDPIARVTSPDQGRAPPTSPA